MVPWYMKKNINTLILCLIVSNCFSCTIMLTVRWDIPKVARTNPCTGKKELKYFYIEPCF